jgi:hypothetical protein
LPSNSTSEILGVLYQGRTGNIIPHKCQWSGDVDQSTYHLHQCRGQFPHRSSSLNVVQVHDCMHLNIACIMSGMRRTNHVTSVQKNSYLKTKHMKNFDWSITETGSDGFWMTGTKPSGNSFVINTETLLCREAVQPGPQFGLPIVEKLKLGLQKCREKSPSRFSSWHQFSKYFENWCQDG